MLLLAARPGDPDKRKGLVCPPLCASRGRDFRRFLKRATIPLDGRTPHSCRHTYAGLMTATGVPSILLATYLGHAATATTAGYSSMAAQYVTQVEGWARGQFRLRPAAVEAVIIVPPAIAVEDHRAN